MPAKFIVADVFDGLATLLDGSVDLVVTSPPFLALRSYLPADHPDKGKETGSESTPAEFIDTLLRVTAELRRVLAPHGSICVELGDTYSGSGLGRNWGLSEEWADKYGPKWSAEELVPPPQIDWANGWPMAKSRAMIPSLYGVALAYGINPLTGAESPAGKWRIRNVVTWARPNPPVGALGDKWRPATSDLIVACTSSKRYWDDLATRRHTGKTLNPRDVRHSGVKGDPNGGRDTLGPYAGNEHPSGAPLLDYWVIPPTGYTGAHYAVFPPELVEPCVKAMCPQRVCLTCGEPSRRIVAYGGGDLSRHGEVEQERGANQRNPRTNPTDRVTSASDLGWTDCDHDAYRPGLILDPFAGSGTTLAVATGHGHDAIGIDLDSRNADLARDRVGPFLFELVDHPAVTP